MKRIKTGDIVRHFKGNYYKVLSMDAIDTETNVKTVVYQSVKTGQIFCRPLDMFMSEVDKSKYPYASQKYRFDRSLAIPYEPLSLDEIKDQQKTCGHITAVTSIDLENYFDADTWEMLNDDLSQQITGSSCGLTDIMMIPIGAGGNPELIVQVTADASEFILDAEDEEED